MDDRNLVGEFLREKIAGYEFRPRVASYGKVVSFSDGVTFVEGLRDVGCDEIIDFGENRYGLAFELSEEERVSSADSERSRALFINLGYSVYLPFINTESSFIRVVK